MTLQSKWDKTEKVNVVTSIFGYNENSSTGGKPRNSAIPGSLDEMFHGDFRTNRPDELSNAIGTKQLEEYSDPFPNYRIKTAVEIGFNTDGQTITDYEVQMDEPNPSKASPVTLEGGSNEPENPFRTSFDYDGTQDFLKANKKGPYTAKKKVNPIDGVEGVRGSIIFGGNDPYLVKLKNDGEEFLSLFPGLAPQTLALHYAEITTFYAFVDFVFMADGTKLVRVWDASVYPAHALYVAGIKRDQNQFRENIEWTVDEPVREDSAFHRFAFEGNVPGLSPFDRHGSTGYKLTFRAGDGPHPAMDYSERGDQLTVDQVKNDQSNPLFPI